MFNHADIIDTRDIIERIEELEREIDAYAEKMDDWQSNSDNEEELQTLLSIMDELKGYGGGEQWRGSWYPLTLIHEKVTADNLRVDYSSVEIEGHTYWFR